MPNRMLRDWTDSLSLEGLSAEAERLFIRLIMKADDFGRYHADPRLVRAGCLPLVDAVSSEQIEQCLLELTIRAMIVRYTVKGRAYLAIRNFGQRLKQSVPKYPAPDGQPRDWKAGDAELPEAIPQPPPVGNPTEEIAQAWNEQSSLPQVAEVSEARREAARARLREDYFAAHWREALTKVASSGFCRGQNERGWQASLDWFLKPGTVCKVMEGRYDSPAAVRADLPTILAQEGEKHARGF